MKAKYENMEIGKFLKEVNDTKLKMDNYKNKKDQANSDYEHYWTVAGTTPTYAWIFPFGLNSACVDGGIYGSKANETKSRSEICAKLLQEESYLKQTTKKNEI